MKAFTLCSTASYSDRDCVFYVKDIESQEQDVITYDKLLGPSFLINDVTAYTGEHPEYTKGGWTHKVNCRVIGEVADPASLFHIPQGTQFIKVA